MRIHSQRMSRSDTLGNTSRPRYISCKNWAQNASKLLGRHTLEFIDIDDGGRASRDRHNIASRNTECIPLLLGIEELVTCKNVSDIETLSQDRKIERVVGHIRK